MLSGVIALIVALVGLVAAISALLSEELNKNKKLKYILVTTLFALTIYAMLGSIVALSNSESATSREQELRATIMSLETQAAISPPTPAAAIPTIVPTAAIGVSTDTLPTTMPATVTPESPMAPPIATSTLEPKPTAPPPTPQPAIADFGVGQPASKDGVELTLLDTAPEVGGIALNWQLKNNTDTNLAFNYGSQNFSARDNLGRPVAARFWDGRVFSCVSPVKFLLEPGKSIRNMDNGVCGHALRLNFDVADAKITEIIITASDIPRIGKAQWRIPVNFR